VERWCPNTPQSADLPTTLQVVLDIEAYCHRIGIERPARPDHETLRRLQLAHMTSVAFENLDVVVQAAVRTTTDWSLPKIVDRRRGGWCFEINGAFAALLEALGYTVARHSARVFDPSTGGLGPELDHLCLVVTIGDTHWLVDAGFGDSSVAPVRLDTPEVQERRPRRARVDRSAAGGWRYSEWMYWDDWELQYEIEPDPTPLAAFQSRSDALAAGAGNGYFTEKPFATRALNEHGDRVWLLRDRLKVRRGDGHRQPDETPIAPHEWTDALHHWFGMSPPETLLDRMP
jgi:N-hydroxyarylamine O-acetyltransferase